MRFWWLVNKTRSIDMFFTGDTINCAFSVIQLLVIDTSVPSLASRNSNSCSAELRSATLTTVPRSIKNKSVNLVFEEKAVWGLYRPKTTSTAVLKDCCIKPVPWAKLWRWVGNRLMCTVQLLHVSKVRYVCLVLRVVCLLYTVLE